MTRRDDRIEERAGGVLSRLATCRPADAAAAFEVGRDTGAVEAAGELAARHALKPAGRTWAERVLADTEEWLDAADEVERGRGR